jgi:hypothetical protein
MVDIQDLKGLDDKYQSQDTKGIYPDDSKEQVVSVFNGGYYKPKTEAIGIPYIGEVQFNLLSSSAGYVNQIHPFKEQATNTFWLGLQNINTTLQDSPIAPNDFIPYETFGESITQFKYMGKHSTYSYLKGSLELSVRIYEDSEEDLRLRGRAPLSIPTLWVEMLSPSKPPAERNNRKGIGMSIPVTFEPISRTNNLRDNINTEYILENLEKFKSKSYLGINNCRILAADVSESLDYSEGNRTTNWIKAESNYIFTTTDGTSTINRIQFKDKNGRIFYGQGLGADNSTANEKLYNIPNNIIEYRICFSTQNDTAKNINIYTIDKDTTNRGLWVKYQVHIDSLVAFAPNNVYGFVLRFYNTNSDMKITKDSFFISSGSISSLANNRDGIQKWKDIVEIKNDQI